MKIVVKGNDHHIPIKLLFPTGLVLNRVTAHFAPRILKDNEITITYAQAMKFIKELKRCKKHFRNWKLVEVRSADGEHIEITL